ncbi:DUF481 domain-containing protein [Saccharobesus litoralis]|uniref:DUF481 domain-containing protein n=1 Tax=Saccharobesus litoralis TaxID=2172099 RepID=A0A2S0VVM2_9ALTE|nr:DUF481 domain-containing protein [Saccharobesus litoralis]AWB68222.1 DUF481 domain-containing protein [Saccharobesus litoralis]
MKSTLTMIALSVVALNAVAEEEKSWQASAELGAIFTSGNTETTSIKGKIDVKQELESWSNQYIFDALLKEDEIESKDSNNNTVKQTQKTAEKYFLSAQGNYKLNTKGSSLFVYGSHTDDKFGGVTKYSTISAGYGQHLYKTSTSLLKADIGPGYVWSKQADKTDGTEGKEDNSGIIRLSADYRWKINEFATFTQAVSFEVPTDSDKNRRSKSVTGFAAKISESMQMKLGLTAINNSEVVEGREKTDIETTVTVVYNF